MELNAKKFLNYFGQLRIYSIIDLVLLLIAIHANHSEFIGVIILHIGFILCLEYNHNHSYRNKLPGIIWISFLILGSVIYSKLIAILGFLIFSFLYAKKNKYPLGILSPLFRGLQIYFLIGGIIGFKEPFSFLAAGLTLLRNFSGDLRDISKDKKENLKTLPILFGIKKDFKNVHLIFLFVTSFVWWYYAQISLVWLILVYIIQLITYNLTPR